MNSTRATDIDTVEANMQTWKKCSSLIETPDEKTEHLMNEKKTADALLLQAQNIQKFLHRNMSEVAFAGGACCTSSARGQYKCCNSTTSG